MHLSRFITIAICARIFMTRPLARAVTDGDGGAVQPVHLIHATDDDELVAVGAHGAVVVQAIALLRVAADHVRRFQHHACHRIVDPAAQAGHFAARHVHDLLLRMVHHHHAGIDPLRNHSARHQRAVGVVGLDPVVVGDADLLRVRLADPDARPAAA